MPLKEFNVRGTKFEVDDNYTIQKYIGCGSYGVVCSAIRGGSETCAIKKIANVFKNETTAKRTLREIKLLLHFNHENIISIKDIMVTNRDCNEIYVVTGLMDTDLHKVIRSPQPLSDQHVQYFLYQLLRGLKYIHSAHVLHRDLKPSNLLVNENCDLKITDFGLSRAVNPSDCLDFLTEYVVTRWYRAPELVLCSDAYTKAIDVWSVGCIFAELLGRKPLFPGNDHVQQLNCILDILGFPTQEEIHKIPEKAQRYLASLPHRDPQPFQTLYPKANPLALDLIQQFLQFDPAKRCTVEEALAHPYLTSFHNPALEPNSPATFSFDFEKDGQTHELLLRDVARFHPEVLQGPSKTPKTKRSRRPMEGRGSQHLHGNLHGNMHGNLPRYGEVYGGEAGAGPSAPGDEPLLCHRHRQADNPIPAPPGEPQPKPLPSHPPDDVLYHPSRSDRGAY